ncbi:MAG: hypothetical protein ABI430_03480 [Candidatus Taylorbacteria bacterium]
MFNVSLYLEKFKTIGLGDSIAKDALIKAVRECTGGKIERKDVEFKNGTFRIKADPILKSEIMIKKEVILEFLTKELKKEVKDVR